MVRFIDCLFKHALLTKLQLQEQEAPEFLMVRGGLGKLKIVIGPGTFFLLLQPVQMLGFLLNSGCVTICMPVRPRNIKAVRSRPAPPPELTFHEKFTLCPRHCLYN
jgi:hypothetical protein